MRKLNTKQLELFNLIRPIFIDHYNNGILPPTFDQLKNKSNFKSFDSTFNAILMRGYIDHYPTNDFSNRFILNSKFN